MSNVNRNMPNQNELKVYAVQPINSKNKNYDRIQLNTTHPPLNEIFQNLDGVNGKHLKVNLEIDDSAPKNQTYRPIDEIQFIFSEKKTSENQSEANNEEQAEQLDNQQLSFESKSSPRKNNYDSRGYEPDEEFESQQNFSYENEKIKEEEEKERESELDYDALDFSRMNQTSETSKEIRQIFDQQVPSLNRSHYSMLINPENKKVPLQLNDEIQNSNPINSNNSLKLNRTYNIGWRNFKSETVYSDFDVEEDRRAKNFERYAYSENDYEDLEVSNKVKLPKRDFRDELRIKMLDKTSSEQPREAQIIQRPESPQPSFETTNTANSQTSTNPSSTTTSASMTATTTTTSTVSATNTYTETTSSKSNSSQAYTVIDNRYDQAQSGSEVTLATTSTAFDSNTITEYNTITSNKKVDYEPIRTSNRSPNQAGVARTSDSAETSKKNDHQNTSAFFIQTKPQNQRARFKSKSPSKVSENNANLNALFGEIETNVTGMSTQIGYINQNGEKNYLKLDEIPKILTRHNRLEDVFVLDDNGSSLALQSCHIKNIKRGWRDILVFQSFSTQFNHGLIKKREENKNNEDIFYQEVAVYKPMLPNDENKHYRNDLLFMLEKNSEKEKEINKSNVCVQSLPNILLFYLSTEEKSVFMWKSCSYEDFSERVFKLNNFRLERIFFRSRRVSCETINQ